MSEYIPTEQVLSIEYDKWFTEEHPIERVYNSNGITIWENLNLEAKNDEINEELDMRRMLLEQLKSALITGDDDGQGV